ncbi:MAG: hypothetical protein ACR2NP_00535, partial [Pirellulaceae bacterium]
MNVSPCQLRPVAVAWKIVRISILAGCAAAIFAPAPVQAWQNSVVESIDVGFDGKVVLGKWVPFTIEVSAATPTDNVTLQMETLDGDAVPIQYNQSYHVDEHPVTQFKQLTGLIRMGRAAGISVRLIGAGGDQVTSRRFSLDELRETHSFLPGTTRLTLFPLGSSGDKTSKDDVIPEFDRHLSDETAVIYRLSHLPTSWIGYDSVRTMVIIRTGRVPNLAQHKAIEKWVSMGGRLIITGGSGFDESFNRGVLGELSPGSFQRNITIADTGSIELFTKINDQLVSSGGPALPVTVIEPGPDRRLEGRAGEHPLIMHWMHGFGKITFISLDVTAEPFLSWEGRRGLMTLAMEDTGGEPTDSTQAQTGRVSHIGFTDIAGQLRAGMDQYKRVSFITFTLVALLVGLFILAIGPGDFFFLKKVTGRMEMTWVTFSLICLAFCGLAWLLASQLKSSETEVNQVEIVDVDTITDTVRGNLWAHIYSPGTETYDVQLPRENSLFGKLDEGWLSWQGLPGRGMGSMQSRSDLGLYRRQYESLVYPQGASLSAIPMQNASTKTLHAAWHGQLQEKPQHALRQSSNSDALLGTVTNPLDKPLYDCVILYGDWVYQLEDRPLEPGETIVVEDDLREKTIAGHFTRLGDRGEDEVSTAWDPRSTRLPRITQMMSFF